MNAYGQEGELWQYPYPLSETEFLVSYSPWGWGREPLLFGIYFTMLDGRRELLVQDPLVSCNQPVPLRRPAPHVRPNTTDYSRQTGTFYVQDVYAGPGLAGLPRGTAKKLRVIGLDFRATVIGGNHNRGEAGEAFVATPVAVAQGSWEAKTVLGETPICADGSAFFTAPARTPLYFQVIDEKGHVMQTMRSWTTLQPGENSSCVGCHEHKNETPLAAPVQATLPRKPRPLEPFYGDLVPSLGGPGSERASRAVCPHQGRGLGPRSNSRGRGLGHASPVMSRASIFVGCGGPCQPGLFNAENAERVIDESVATRNLVFCSRSLPLFCGPRALCTANNQNLRTICRIGTHAEAQRPPRN